MKSLHMFLNITHPRCRPSMSSSTHFQCLPAPTLYPRSPPYYSDTQSSTLTWPAKSISALALDKIIPTDFMELIFLSATHSIHVSSYVCKSGLTKLISYSTTLWIPKTLFNPLFVFQPSTAHIHLIIHMSYLLHTTCSFVLPALSTTYSQANQHCSLSHSLISLETTCSFVLPTPTPHVLLSYQHWAPHILKQTSIVLCLIVLSALKPHVLSSYQNRHHMFFCPNQHWALIPHVLKQTSIVLCLSFISLETTCSFFLRSLIPALTLHVLCFTVLPAFTPHFLNLMVSPASTPDCRLSYSLTSINSKILPCI